MTNDNEKYYFAKNDIFFNFNIKGPNPEVLYDPTYFDLQISQASYSRDKNNKYGVSSNYTSIPYELWGDNIPEVEKKIINSTDYTKYICPKNKDFYIRANYNSDNYKIIEIDFNRCTGASWKSDAEVYDILSTHYIDFGLVSNYFDFNDYDSPVHSYLQDLN